jgi:predicted DNA-binding WGR domain protein
LNANDPQPAGACDPATSTLLHRINPDRDERRFYWVMVGPSLFEPHAVVRLWGRIGGHQQAMITPCQSMAEAQMLAGKLVWRRLKRGYHIIGSTASTNGEGK